MASRLRKNGLHFLQLEYFYWEGTPLTYQWRHTKNLRKPFFLPLEGTEAWQLSD